MIIVAGTFRVPEDRIEAMMAVARATLDASRKEAGCILYAFAFDLEDRGLVRVYEEWESRSHLEAHFKQPHMVPWRQTLAAIGAHGRSLKVYETDAGISI
jgi:quinol monooxygenase YgiN